MNSTLNRGVKRRSHTACMSMCDLSISQSPNLRSSAAMYLLLGNTAGAGQHRLIMISTIEDCGRVPSQSPTD